MCLKANRSPCEQPSKRITSSTEMEIGDILGDIPDRLSEELSEALVDHGNVTIERIVSKGHRSEQDFWYDQDRNEWVMLVKGEAMLRFEEGDRLVRMTEGSWVNIAAHERHRVEWTTEDTESIWLAVFY